MDPTRNPSHNYWMQDVRGDIWYFHAPNAKEADWLFRNSGDHAYDYGKLGHEKPRTGRGFK